MIKRPVRDKLLYLMKEVSVRVLYEHAPQVPYKHLKECRLVLRIFLKRVIRSSKDLIKELEDEDL